MSAEQALGNWIPILENRTDIVDDLIGLSEDQRAQGWRELEAAMRNCRSEGFGEEELKGMLDAVAAFGKDKLRWVAKLRVDAERKMFAVQMP